MTQQIYTTPTPFSGTNISIPNSGKGYTSNMVIKGQTYQNIVNNFSEGWGHTNGFTIVSPTKIHAQTDGASPIAFTTNKESLPLLKPNTLYTVIALISNNTLNGNFKLIHSYEDVMLAKNSVTVEKNFNGLKIDTFTTIDNLNSPTADRLEINIYTGVAGEVTIENLIILEGNWTNKEVPSSITGIESVGEKENNKISILSHNKNLFKIVADKTININGLTITFNRAEQYIKINGTVNADVYMYGEDKESTVYPYWIDCKKVDNKISISAILTGDYTGNSESDEIVYLGFVSGVYGKITANKVYTPQQDNIMRGDISRPWIRIKSGCTFNNAILKIQYEISDTTTKYKSYKEDKKEILLPIEGGLKSLPDGTCDTIEQREDGVYLVQRVGKYTWTGAESFSLDEASDNSGNYVTYHNRGLLVTRFYICDKFIRKDFRDFYSDDSKNMECTSDGDGYPRFYIRMLKSKLNENTVSGFKKWLQANPVTVYYKFDTPVETKLDIDNINLQTFKDLTYVISDNNIEPVLEFKAPILGYKTINPIQLKTTQDGAEVNVYPYSTPELITFGDNETLADKMNNLGNTHNHNNATVTTDGFMSKESYAKLESLTEYTHPSTHAATMITEDSTHRFITDTERNNWNAKASTNIATPSTNGLMSNTDKQKIDRISNNFDIVYDANTETIRFRFR